ncbi:TSC22 domain family protein 2-like isoform X2 [Acipenser oxyrinchus oxyrinchus]|uniref:TSC22 domain family protein 2-like isoform X2 n=1 Tax=Acipenser oxyrinchus oxyrinchus TaxID=40147 RepID=A0AAD8D3G8_ACIOX|nr:TSC22 domain family protein 2-like isoform X2 [Acipenser oxyrinchus oxyrinchus]
MSKMPAKKKSCFQITSVTQAQVAASSITDDTESLDDPDESRTEDVSSEIFDVSRATDLEPEEACERSSSEETLNNVGETEASGAITPNIPQDGQAVALRSTVLTDHSGVPNVNPQVLGVGGTSAQPPAASVGGLQQSTPAASTGGSANVSVVASQSPPPTAAAAASTTTTCSSRFRVIKLDHGTGEPFRRGRWTCMEFYERDSEGSIITRTVDSMRHATTLEHSTDRDSGLGATGGSVVGPAAHSTQGPDSTADSSFAAVSHSQQADQSSQPSQQQGYGMGLQTASGTMAQGAFQPLAYSNPAVPGIKQNVVPTQQAQVNVPPATAQIPHGHNGMSMQHQSVTMQQAGMPMPSQHQQVQNPPSIPPVSQPQQFAYSVQPQQLPPAHLLPSQPSTLPSSQPDYRQHLHLQSAPGSTAQTLLVSSLPVGQPVNQGPSPVMTPAASGAQVLGLPAQTGESAGQGTGVMQGSQSAPAQGVLQQQGGVVQQGVGTVPGVVQLQQQQAMSQHQAPGVGGSSQLLGLHPGVLGVQNVPAVVPSTGILSGSTSVPGVSSNPVTMPNVTPTIGQSNMMSQSQASRVANLAQAGGSGLQGLPSVASNLPQFNFGQFQAQTQSVVSQVDENRRNSDVLPQPSVISGKDFIKPFIPEPLHLSSATPMNSITTTVFGIPITIDGDEDSTSGASVVAIDNKIEQAMDLVKSHLMYAVREEVEVLKEQIKELYERNSVLERENALLKSLANNDQLSQLPVQLTNPSSTSPPQQQLTAAPTEGGSQPTQLPQQPNVSSA